MGTLTRKEAHLPWHSLDPSFQLNHFWEVPCRVFGRRKQGTPHKDGNSCWFPTRCLEGSPGFHAEASFIVTHYAWAFLRDRRRRPAQRRRWPRQRRTVAIASEKPKVPSERAMRASSPCPKLASTGTWDPSNLQRQSARFGPSWGVDPREHGAFEAS